MHKLDGVTKGPNALSGNIGKLLSSCENMPVAQFIAIKGPNMPLSSGHSELSKDQKYLMDICNAIYDGQCSRSIELRNPGPLSHARWLTTANRILRLYIATNNPSENLKSLAEFIIRVYAPTWFQIKMKPQFFNGPKHLWFMINSPRYMPDHLKQIIDPVIQRGGYFAHPENLLAAMLLDERKVIRKLALQRIVLARKKGRRELRKFELPKLEFSSQDYSELILFNENARLEPPVTKNLSLEELENIVIGKDTESLNLLRECPCHSQAVERHIKLVTEASASVCGKEIRDGLIMTRKKAREQMPKFESKCDFTV